MTHRVRPRRRDAPRPSRHPGRLTASKNCPTRHRHQLQRRQPQHDLKKIASIAASRRAMPDRAKQRPAPTAGTAASPARTTTQTRSPATNTARTPRNPAAEALAHQRIDHQQHAHAEADERKRQHAPPGRGGGGGRSSPTRDSIHVSMNCITVYDAICAIVGPASRSSSTSGRCERGRGDVRSVIGRRRVSCGCSAKQKNPEARSPQGPCFSRNRWILRRGPRCPAAVIRITATPIRTGRSFSLRDATPCVGDVKPRVERGQGPNGKGRPTNRPPFVQKFVIVPRASPEVHVRRRRGRVRCRTSPPEHSCVSPPRNRTTPGRTFSAPLAWAGPPVLPPAGVPVTGLPPSPRLLPVAGGGGVPRGCVRFKVRPPTVRDPRSRGRERVIRRRRPGRLSRPLRRRAALASSSPARPSHRPGQGASPEGSVSLQRSLAVPRCPVWPTSADDPAAAFVTVSPRPPPLPAASIVEAYRCVRDAWRDGRRPLRFSACTAATTAFPLSSRVGHRFERVMHRRSFTAGVPLPARAVAHSLAGVPRIAAPAASLGFLPFAALLPAPAGVAAFPAARTHLPFPRSLVPTLLKVRCLVGPSGRLPPEGEGDRRPRVTGRGSSGFRPRRRSVPWRTLHVPPRPMPP